MLGKYSGMLSVKQGHSGAKTLESWDSQRSVSGTASEVFNREKEKLGNTEQLRAPALEVKLLA